MTFAAVSTAIGALIVGILVGHRVGTAPSSSPGGGVTDLVRRVVLALPSPVVLLNNDLSPLEHGARFGQGPAAVLGEVPALGEKFAVVDAPDDQDATRLDEIRRDFMANVGHELKTPVGAMALLAEAALSAADDPHEVRRFGTKILHEANRLGTLVTELIALSRLQGAGRLAVSALVEVDTVVQKALDRCRLGAESADIRITVDPPSGLLVNGDATLLVTALSNLMDNAVSYSPAGSSVSVRRRLANGVVEIAVTDRGVGIAPAHQERVFERFFCVDPVRSRSTGGTGLGLAIVKHVAANHGGDVQLRSRRGTGSTFTLRIPAHPDSPPRTPCTPSVPEYKEDRFDPRADRQQEEVLPTRKTLLLRENGLSPNQR